MGNKIKVATAVVMLIGIASAGYGLWIPAKAVLAQILLERAWTETRSGRPHVKPWPWADTWPVARLELPRQEFSLIVLSGASGRTLAFGPGHLDSTPLPDQPGNCVISAHRDTHFSSLEQVRLEDKLTVETADGKLVNYRVAVIKVVHFKDTSVLAPSDQDTITLITCYPFEAVLPGGSLRYVVVAVKV